MMRWLLGTMVLALLVTASPARAQEASVVDEAALDRALVEHVAAEDAQRATVRRVLAMPEVREVAERTGVDVERLEAGVGTLAGEDLLRVARHAGEVEGALVGGQSITITVTTLIIILLLVILIVLLAD